jgi:hypothetical protein
MKVKNLLFAGRIGFWRCVRGRMDKEGAKDCVRNTISTLKDFLHDLDLGLYTKCHMDVTIIESNMKSIRRLLEQHESEEMEVRK